MITVPKLAAETLGAYLADHLARRFGAADARLTEFIPSAAALALECIGNSDALFHNVEHTMLVTLAGYDIMKGRALVTATSASDFAHVICACLFHDIGYVRGILKDDTPDNYVVDGNGGKVKLPRGSSDAALMPYHIERSKLYVMDRIGHSKILDAARIARAIEYTRIRNNYDPSEDEDGMLLRAADMIGQLGDPHYLRKANALYHEFEEVGMNRQLGYTSPADLTRRYPQHYWNMISPHIQTAIRYLNFTSSGRQWIANLYANIFCAERDLSLSGPEK
ncbi:MAG TPA: metal-dependent phosphohydrolase [Xanthobacteraceae bacterium]|jgi:hypothetical protein|nr:metal-dependent phosphohydrolase [Xanthobacteraceae bacterium]